MSAVAESAPEVAGQPSELQVAAVKAFVHLLGQPKTPLRLLGGCIWAVGEFGARVPGLAAEDLVRKLADLPRRHALDDTLTGQLLTAITKICSTAGHELPEAAQSLLRTCGSSRSVDLQQRALEAQALLASGARSGAAAAAAPLADGAPALDESLSFLDGHVAAALARGAAPYQSPEERVARALQATQATTSAAGPGPAAPHPGLRFDAYEQPVVPSGPVAVREASMGRLNPVPGVPVPVMQPVQPQYSTVPPPPTTVTTGAWAQAPPPETAELRLLSQGGPRKWGPAQFEQPAPPRPASGSSTAAAPAQQAQVAPPVVTQQAVPSRAAQPLLQQQDPEKLKLAGALFGGEGQVLAPCSSI